MLESDEVGHNLSYSVKNGRAGRFNHRIDFLTRRNGVNSSNQDYKNQTKKEQAERLVFLHLECSLERIRKIYIHTLLWGK